MPLYKTSFQEFASLSLSPSLSLSLPLSPSLSLSLSVGDVVTASVHPQERGLQDKLNVIIFSDHGMTDIFWMDKVIELDQYISLADLQQVKDRGPVVSLWPAPGRHSEARRVGKGAWILGLIFVHSSWVTSIKLLSTASLWSLL